MLILSLGYVYSFRQRLDFLTTLRAGAADLSIRKSSRFFPALIAAVNQRGCAPRPAQVFPSVSRYFGATFMPLVARPCFRRPFPISPPPPVSPDSWPFRPSAFVTSTAPI